MIDFEHKTDRDHFYQSDRVKNLVKLLKGDGKTFIKSVASILFYSSTSEDFAHYCPIIREMENTKLELGSDSLREAYKNIIGLLSVIFDDKRLAPNLKGAILELFVFKSIETTYGDKSYINGHVLIKTSTNEWKSNKSVDVMGINSEMDNGECYECKSRFEDLDSEIINNLNEIHIKSNFIIDPIIASFANKSAIENYLKDIPTQTTNIKCIGSAELQNL